MQRLFSLKLISKTSKNFSKTSSSLSVCSQSVHSLPRTNPLHLQSSRVHQPHHFFSHYTICSYSWRSQTSGFVKFNRFLSNSVLVKQLLRNALLKGRSKGLVDGGVEFFRTQFPRRSFHYNSAFDSRGWQSRLRRRLTTEGVVLGLIVTNIAIFMLWQIADRRFMVDHFTVQLDNFKSGRVHTLITSAFSHNEVGHIISNMIGLYFFGMSIGRTFGPEFLLKMYFAGALGGSVFYLVHHAFMSSSKDKRMWGVDQSKVPGLGASGAVNAIMLLDIFLFPKKTIYLEFFIPVPAMLLGIFLIGKDMLRILQGDSQISGSAHLGGAAVAAIAWVRMRRGRF